MKKIILISAAALSVSLAASAAMASLSSDIQSMGMCKAVGSAVSNGVPVSSIVTHGATLKKADQKTLLTALYAAGASDDVIRISAEKARISDLVLIDAFNTSSKQGCVDDRGAAQNMAAAKASPALAATGKTASAVPPVVAETAIPVGQSVDKATTTTTTGKATSAASPVVAETIPVGQSVEKATTTAPASKAALTTAPVAAETAIPIGQSMDKAATTPTASKAASPAETASQPARKTATTARKTVSPATVPFVSWTGPRPAMMGDYWDTFYKNYKTIGIDQAAILAITEGVQPAALIEAALVLESELSPQEMIKSMYCAGYNGDDIKKACNRYKISDLILVSGFQKSKAECTQDCRDRDNIADTQAYTPAEAPPADPPGPPPTAPPPPPPALLSSSPSSFNL